MPGFLRTLRLFFEREIRQLRRFCLPRFRPSARRAHPRQLARHVGAQVAASAPDPGPPPSKRSHGSGAWASFSFSGLIHAVLLLAIAGWWLPQQSDNSTTYGEIRIAIRVPPPEKVVEPAREPEEAPPPLEIQSAVAKERDAPPAPGPDTEESLGNADTDTKPERGLPVEKSTSLTDIAPPPLPRTFGLGSSPLPLPGAGNGVKRGFSTRSDGKGEALRRHGGGGATESAVGRGLRWLAEHQDVNGGWSSEGFQRHCGHSIPCAGKGLREFDVGVSALATLAFLGAGHLPDTSRMSSKELASAPAVGYGTLESTAYSRNAEKALGFLLDRQDGKGAFGAFGDNYMYNHALATLAMAEAVSMTGLRLYRVSLEAAVAFSSSAQQPGGGWDYTSQTSERNDLSITGWQIMALRAAETAGVPVAEGVFQRLRAFLDRAVLSDGEGVYANIGDEAGRRGINMTAVGLLSLIYMGALPESSRVQRAAQRVLRTPPDWQETGAWEKSFQSYYYWYVGSLALFHLGGEPWKAWNALLLRQILPLQSRKQHELGSWPPEPSWIGISGGRVYATAVNVLTLETYYRYEPIYRTRRS